MTTTLFNPQDWVWPLAEPTDTEITNIHMEDIDISKQEVERIIGLLIERRIDMTPNYITWRNLGFALVDGFGEQGRKYYQEISQFYPGYSSQETDSQFDKCLRATGHGITLKSFFYFAKKAGIDISSGDRYDSEPEEKAMPTFSNSRFSQFPQFLQRVVSVAETPEERDLL